LDGVLERNLFDAGKLKTTTIVSYGMQPLVKLGGNDSVYSIWNDAAKESLKDKNSTELLDAYVKFAVEHIRDFLILAKNAIGENRWAIRSKDGDGVLTVTSVNGLLILMRNLIASGELDVTKLHVELGPLAKIDFAAAKSSQYAALAVTMHSAVSKKGPV
jgi:hypothetical protein